MVKQSMVRILHPEWKRRFHPVTGEPIQPKPSDYIEVSRLSTYGSFEMADIVPFEQLAGLSRLRDQLAGVIRRKEK